MPTTLVDDFLAFLRAHRAPNTFRQYRKIILRAQDSLQEMGKTFETATTEDLESVVGRWAREHGPATVRARVGPLRTLGRWAANNGYWSTNLTARLDTGHRRVTDLDMSKDFSNRVATRLRIKRHAKRLRLSDVGGQLNLGATEISRVERGERALSLGHLTPWAHTLGLRVEMVMWPANADEEWDEEQLYDALADVASALAHMPPTAKRSLVAEMRAWRNADDGTNLGQP